MTWNDKVVWQEGMFLRAQHYQQQDRYFEHLLQARAAPLVAHPWGVTELALDRDLLAAGKLSGNHTPCDKEPWGVAAPGSAPGVPWHPNAAGHDAIAQALVRMLSN